jgi:FAD/FMN-containing dehydrogenase
MRAFDIDAEQRTAWVEAGMTAGEFTAEAAKYGLGVGFGDTGSVGIGGITVGGGVGYLVRKYGLTIDSLLAADVVTADGECLRVDEENHPDLFWAIRGGGGNFGVVTRFQFKLHEVSTIVGGMMMLPATPEVIAGFVAAAKAAPEELSTIANIMPAPPMPFVPKEQHGKIVIMGMLAYVGDADEGQRAMAPFRALATPIVNMLKPITYPEMYPPEEQEYHPIGAAHTMFINDVDLEVAKTIVDRLKKSTAFMSVAQLRVLGGAMARVPADATAFAHRKNPIMVNVAALYGDPSQGEAHKEWVKEFAEVLNQGDNAAYVNFLAEEGEERTRAAYPGATWDRLVEVKRRYDPTNLFRLNQNIPPAAQASEG